MAGRGTVPTGQRKLRRTAGRMKKRPPIFRSAALRYLAERKGLAFRLFALVGWRFGGLLSRSRIGFLNGRLGRFTDRFQLLGGEWGRVFLEHLLEDVDTLRLKIRFLGRTGDVDLDVHRDFWMERDPDLVHPDRLDRPIEHDLALGDPGADALERFDDVAGADRAVKVTHVR